MAAKALSATRTLYRSGGSVPASGAERIRTCEREGLCPSSRHSRRQSGSLEENFMPITARAGDGVALAVLPVSKAPESGEAPRRSLWPCR
jgi:hypothetical protein